MSSTVSILLVRVLTRRKTKKSKAPADAKGAGGDDGAKENTDPKPHPEVEVEYVPEKADLDDFKSVFEKFCFKEPIAAAPPEGEEKESAADTANEKGLDSDDDDEQETQKVKEGALSNKQKKLLQRMKIVELKQICNKPDVVEVWDATATDPKLLVHLKSYRNTVPVPRHWSQKRKFLQELF